MTTEVKIIELGKIIYDNLVNLIDADFVLLDVPYHYNIGDVLIWQGELDFLKKLPYKHLNYGFQYQRYDIKKSDIILLHGGGNFGDLWRGFQEYKLSIIAKYPENKIIIFPQTVYYNDYDTLIKDAMLMSQHKNLTICARDEYSYIILKQYFTNNILLIPDMAFCIYMNKYKKYICNTAKQNLYLKRNDKEYVNNDIIYKEMSLFDIKDWPTQDGTTQNYCLYDNYLIKMSRRCARRKYLKWMTSFWIGLNDWYIHSMIKKRIIATGISFISSYDSVLTTRLHAAILRILLNKNVSIIDNSYGKNSCFYNTWLEHMDAVKMIL